METDQSMRVSVIIPAKNEENYLKKCLMFLKKSIADYNKPVQIVLVDNGSVDDTIKIAKDFDCRVIEKPNLSTISALRNSGAKGATCDIVAFLDADCLVHSKWLSYCLSNFKDPQIGAVGTRAMPDFDNATWVEKCWFKLIVERKTVQHINWLGTSNIFIKKDLFNDIGGFDECLQTGEDVALGYNISKKQKMFLERRINTIHLRESKTLSELFKRELWRGKDGFKSLRRNNYNLKEIPSVIIPILFLISLAILPLNLVNGSDLILVVSLVAPIMPFAFVLKKKVSFTIKDIISCYIIAAVYLLARSCSFFIKTKRS